MYMTTTFFTDFGVSKPLTETLGTVAAAGTPMYMAPEGGAGLEVDVYSFGVLLWAFLHRRHPWPADVDPFDLVNRVREGECV